MNMQKIQAVCAGWILTAAMTPVGWAQPEARPLLLPELVELPGGSFQMGDIDGLGTEYERPVRTVQVPAFAIGKYEVTFNEWAACLTAGGCKYRPSHEGWGADGRPVINVSWNDAQEYVRWLSKETGDSYRLPTEAEWEYAARAGTETRYSWGDGSEWMCQEANVFDRDGLAANPDWNWHVQCKDGEPFTARVGQYRPNPWGLHDMFGNVWEWTEDCWHPDYTGAPTDGSAWTEDGQCSKRVNRGGGWGNHPRTMRSATRDADNVGDRGDGLGFRVVRDIAP
jgi:formylglycine-generating enzyme required for sulfatase activity